MANNEQEKDWVKVLYEVIMKILTLGFYHVGKNSNGERAWNCTKTLHKCVKMRQKRHKNA